MLNPEAPPFDYQQCCVVSKFYPCSFTASYPLPPPLFPVIPWVQVRSPRFYPCNKYTYHFPLLPPTLCSLTACTTLQTTDFGASNYNKGTEEYSLEPMNEFSFQVEEPTKNIHLKRKSGVASFRRIRGGSYLGRFRAKKVFNLIWRPKLQSKEELKGVSIASGPKEFDSDDEKLTAVMIRNIPSRFRKMLVDLLDKHCTEENEKAQVVSEVHPSEYDFLYLPFDFKSRCNLGYAFVNFTDSIAPKRFYQAYHDYKWGVFDSQKICEISYARIQGKEALVRRFKNSQFCCLSDEYLPVLFDPPRNGSSSCTSPSIVGTWISSK